MLRRLLAVVAAASSLLVLVPLLPGSGDPAALAHAQLVSSLPGSGEVVATAPAALVLAFSEPIDSTGTSADVLDGEGRALVVEGGAPDPGDPHSLVVPLPVLADGAYSVHWRSLSAADGHSSLGFLTFAVGAGTAPPDLSSGGGMGDVHGGHGASQAVLESVGRTAGDLGAMLAFGLWLIALLVVRPVSPGLMAPLARGAISAAILGAVGAEALALSASDNASLGVVAYLTGTHSGQLVLVRGLELLVAGAVGWLLLKRDPTASLDVVGLGGSAALGLLAASGHAAAFSSLVSVLAMFVHLATAAIWLSGLVVLAWLAWRGWRARPADLDPGPADDAATAPAEAEVATGAALVGVSSDPPLAAYVPRFSALALVSGALFVLTGVLFAFLQAGAILGFDSQYGQALAAKSALVVLALGLGAWNYLDPARRRGSSGGVGRRVVVEAGLAVAIVAITSLLASGSPPAPTQPTPLAAAGANVTQGIGLSLQPARPGPNRFVADIAADVAGGDPQAVEVDLQRLDLDQGLSRLQLRAVAGMPGRWQADGGLLPPDSRWTASVVLRDAAGAQSARGRFDFALDADGLSAGRAEPPIDVSAVIAVLLLALALFALVYALAGGSPPRTEPATGRRALLAGAAVAAPLGLLVLLAWPGQ